MSENTHWTEWIPLRDNRHMAIGIDLGGTKLLTVTLDRDGQRSIQTFPTGPCFSPPELCRIIATLAPHNDRPLGLAVPGLVNPQGRIDDCDVLPRFTGWHPNTQELPGLKAILNDGEAALTLLAAGHPPQATLSVVGCGTGLVVASQIGGQRLRALRPFSGELGYAPFGLAGTFDEHASGKAILNRLGGRLPGADDESAQVIAAAADAFGASLATILHLIHPERIGLYGGVLRFPGYLERALATLDRLSHPLLRASCQVALLPDPDLAVALGALHAARQA